MVVLVVVVVVLGTGGKPPIQLLGHVRVGGWGGAEGWMGCRR